MFFNTKISGDWNNITVVRGVGYTSYKNSMGDYHRLDGPAYKDRLLEEWWQFGHRHRIDGPAYIYGNETKCWYLYGLKHRIDGPAIEEAFEQYWWLLDKRHRIGGPAVIKPNYKAWFINGREYSQCEYNQYIKSFHND